MQSNQINEAKAKSMKSDSQSVSEMSILYTAKESSAQIINKNIIKNNIVKNWIPFSIKGTGADDAYLDPSLDHPFIPKSKSVWKKIGGKYSILTYGGSARIDKNNITTRLDSKNKTWIGFRKKDIY